MNVVAQRIDASGALASDTLVVLPTMHVTGFKSCTGQSSGALAHSLEHSEIAFFPNVK